MSSSLPLGSINVRAPWRRLLAGAVAAWVLFALVGLAAQAGALVALDHAALQAARELRAAHPSLTGALRDVSGFGSTVALALMTLAAAFWLVRRGSRSAAAAIVIVLALGVAADDAAKAVVTRHRPDVADAAFVVTTYSYPSGHAALSMLVFLVLAAVLTQRQTPRAQRDAIGIAFSFALLVGASRVGLGVHWASDVVGGWLFGAANALAAVAALRRFG